MADTAVFVAIISRSYLERDSCIKELNCPLSSIKNKNLEKARDPKIVAIFQSPKRPTQELPRELQGQIYHKFFDDTSGCPREFRPKGGDAKDRREFWNTFWRVVLDLTAILEELKGIASQRLEKDFVATVCQELEKERNQLRADLQQRGYLVVPEHDYMWNSDGLKDSILRDLEQAQMCIHLVSGAKSTAPFYSPDYAMRQLELAQQVMERKKHPAPVVWIQPSDREDPSAKKLLDYIRNDLANLGAEILDRGIEDLKTQIYDKLDAMPRPDECTAAS